MEAKNHSTEPPAAPLRTRITTERQRELLAQLNEAVRCRAAEETAIQASRAQREQEARQRYIDARDELVRNFEKRQAELITHYKQARDEVVAEGDRDAVSFLAEEEKQLEQAVQQQDVLIAHTQQSERERQRVVLDTFKAQEGQPQAELLAFKQQCEASAGEVQMLIAQAREITNTRRAWTDPACSATPIPSDCTTAQRVELAATQIQQSRDLVQQLASGRATRFLSEGYAFGVLVLGVLAGAVLLWLTGIPFLYVAIGSLIIGVLSTIPAYLIARPMAFREMTRKLPTFHQATTDAIAALQSCLESATVDADRKYRQLVAKRDRDLQQVRQDAAQTLQRLASELEQKKQDVGTDFRTKRRKMERSQQQELEALQAQRLSTLREYEFEFEQQSKKISQQFYDRRHQDRAALDQEWNALKERWQCGVSQFQSELDHMRQYCDRYAPNWSSLQKIPEFLDAMSHTEPPVAVRLGDYHFRLQDVPGGISSDPALAVPRSAFDLPVLLAYPETPSLLLHAEADGREAATQALQNAMLRILSAFPPGKVRFTIIDPIGLGQNFSAFMHLADYDDKLVNSRIWTESNHINQRLADLTEHMENVIQKYLRNEFATIHDYNQQAGEVAEPFQILVAANFPANFSDEASRRLLSIAHSGARCGVYTLISHDTKLSLPRGFDMRDLEAHSTTLVWSDADRRFSWREADLANLAVTLELPLEGDRLTELVREVGRRAKDAVRVEVPFHSIIPSASDWWQRDSRAEIEVPLGRAGAKKLQYLKLGRGTSQHVLISGKTGSGKSTLLNAIITSLAVHYSPEELQFYLIDFKKGVEFKAYATHRLPHARVIAIESEREFGLSVLERLDQELKNRGDLFRKAGVQDLKSYRNSTPDKTLPRILLVIDEFQEFFTSDDKIAHDSALLLDRLVRQGRAFGIHVMLGSQTLAGAYSLARSTLGQMAVRIALQCSESDAHLILSEDNTAARLLSRPGEAIYNDANGLLEGNHPFQVVWLPDAEREQYLQGLHALSNQRGIALEATTVFEGNVPAEPRDNPMLVAALDTPATSTTSRAWLGAAVAIKDPTCASFRRQAGSNLLIVGQQEEMAVGILANSMISLSPNALRRTGSDAPATELSTSIYVLDGTQADSPLSGTWPRIAATLDANIQVITPREAAGTLSQLAAEVERRLAANDPSAPSIFVVIHHLARFRDLKKSEDFGMSSFSDDEGAVRGDKCLATLLREGPSLGIHTMIWCDSYNNFYRWVERPLLRDLDQRVLFQMSAADSSNLIDSPAASKLGEHMALFYSEELGQLEKFRPYEVPTITWLDFVADKLRQHRDAKTHA